MPNNYEMSFLKMGPELARAQNAGFSAERAAAISHSFFVPSGATTDLLRRLRSEGFVSREDDSSPVVTAVRNEVVTVDHLKSLTRDMCDLADKFAAEYDGWKVDN